MLRIRVQQPSDHPLVLGMLLPRLVFEKLDASLAQRNGDFDSFLSKGELLRARKEVRNDLQVSERFVRIRDFPAHQ